MAKKEMDKLSREVAQALACGMSYGKWKAKQEPVKIVKQEYPADWRLCEHCGKPFKPVQGKRFCDIYCRDRAYRKKQNEIMREYMRKYRTRKEEEGITV